nr:Forssman antigen-binding lectin=GalNAc alpha 1-3GalNAc beta 1-3Gal alpha 1-4Gal beta 1-4Glc beta 1-1Cer)-binding lectin {internal fragment} [Mucuna deeringiana=velvet bean, seeds, Peptide Partial, 56 aa] [Mucuna pruriens var. utilis]
EGFLPFELPREDHGMMFVVPPGHPFLAIAAYKENLQIISFEVNAYDNNKYTYAGKD